MPVNVGQYIISFAHYRGRTLKSIAENMNINYKTFVGKLNRNCVSANELLKLADILDMDLEEMKSLNKKLLPRIPRYPRMSSEDRKIEYSELKKSIYKVSENNFDAKGVLSSLLKRYSNFKLLDILLDDSAEIVALSPNEPYVRFNNLQESLTALAYIDEANANCKKVDGTDIPADYLSPFTYPGSNTMLYIIEEILKEIESEIVKYHLK